MLRVAAPQYEQLATELAKAEVAVIIAGGNALARAGKSATSKIPILFVIADDPVRLGFVESFKRPGGNMTGLSMISGTLGAKRMELLRELVPKATAIAMLINPNNPAEDNVRDEQAAARAIGQRILVAEASTVRDIEIAFEGIVSTASRRSPRQRRFILHQPARSTCRTGCSSPPAHCLRMA